VNAPIAAGTRMESAPPILTRMRDGTMITHTEYLGELTPQTNQLYGNLTVTGSYINPGLANQVSVQFGPAGAVGPVQFPMPWLSGVASSFEEYEFVELEYFTRSECATTQAGTVYLAFNPDPTDSLPVNKTELLQFRNSSSNVWANCSLRIPARDMKALGRTLYVSNSPSTYTDLRTAMRGMFIAATSNVSSGISVEVWCRYKIKLSQPVIPALNNSAGASQYSAVVQYGGSATNTNPFVGATVTGGTNSGIATIVSPVSARSSATDILFNQTGQYLLSFAQQIVSPAAYSAGPSIYQDLGSAIISNIQSLETSQEQVNEYIVNVLNAPFALGFSTPITGGGSTPSTTISGAQNDAFGVKIAPFLASLG